MVRTPIHYFDVLGGVVAIALLAGIVWRVIAADTAGVWVFLAIGAFLTALGLLAACRPRAYRQTIPWLAGSFAVTACIALIAVFSSWPLVWFVGATATGGLLLLCALILRRKQLSDPVSRRDVFTLAAVALSALLSLVAIELALRLAPGIVGAHLRPALEADPGEYGVPHPYIGYLHRPNGATVVTGSDFKAVHAVDALGFRNPWPWPASADLVVVGDSVTFGYGAATEEAWPAIVARERPDTPLVNLALIGAGPQQYLRVYETFGAALHPKLLLVGVFAGNDFWDAEVFDRWLQSGAGGNYMVWRDFGRPGPWTMTIADPKGSLRSLFDWYGYPALRSSRVFNLLRALRGGMGGSAAHIEFEDGSRIWVSPDETRSMLARASEGERGFRLALDAFEQIHALAGERGTRVLMVLQPSKGEVYLPLVEGNVHDLSADLRRAFDARGIDYLDLGPAFRERAAAGERLFFERDGHPNAAGYALTARLVLSHLAGDPDWSAAPDHASATAARTDAIADAMRHR